ncbi:MAG TPA: lasso peptide biosynthesis B2 protein, partial [Allosphingosinicella sp.]|nr:lasso peptide biosynthesis B2 protein [Allosphingosinicella sp.]
FLLAEALVMLAIASAMVRLLPFRRIVGLAQSPLRARKPGDVDTDRLRRAVEAWARRVPWRAVCIQCALALHLLLRRRGVPSDLHYGIRNSGDRPLSAHVWLSVDGVTLIGGEAAADHVPVATFRAKRPDGL